MPRKKKVPEKLPPSKLHLPNILETEHAVNLDGNLRLSALHLLKNPCPVCGATSHRHGDEVQTFHDMPVSGQRVVIQLARPRYRCSRYPVCKKTWLEPLDPAFFHEKRHVTQKVWKHIREHVWDNTFSGLALHVGVDETLVRRLFLDYVEELDLNYKPTAPRVLGIDEVHLAKKARGILVDLETGRPYDLLETHTRAAFSRRFLRMADRDRVRIVTMDQTAYFRRMVREFFPNATVIADKWHILVHADKALDRVRIDYRDKLPKVQRAGLFGDRWLLKKRLAAMTMEEQIVLNTWSINHPTIGLAYQLREAFYAIYDLADRAEAERRYAHWKGLITKETAPFRHVAKSVDRWHDQVFNYFSHGRYTNARTEQVNGTIKAVQRDGRGYSFDILRAKIVLGQSANIRKRVDPADEDWVKIEYA